MCEYFCLSLRRLFEGGVYSNNYGISAVQCTGCAHLCLPGSIKFRLSLTER